MATSSAVKVCVRLRPLNKREKRGNTIPVVTANTEKGEINVVKGLSTKATRHGFNFDNVFSEFATQEEVFNQTLLPIVEQVMKGYEATVFAYGQTGTGKTYTMEGDINVDSQRGVIPRSCESIFDQLENSGKFANFKVTVSYLEIYNEELSDLLVEKGKNLRVCEQRGKIHCMGLSEMKVNSTKEIINIIQKAQERRQVAETKMNRASSRSHCLFTLRVISKEKVKDGVIEREGKLHLVDLAGSECAKSTGESVKSARFRESQNINKSLLTLGRVITALRDRLPRIPYRDSKLTRLLQEALGGRSQTCIIATLSPSILCVDETLSTLSYAEQAQGIKNKPVKAQVRMQANVGSSLSKGNNGSNLDGASRETFAEMEQRMLYMQAQCKEAQAALGRKHEEVSKLVARAELAENKVEELSINLLEANDNIEKAKVQNNKICLKLKETMQESMNKTYIIKARTETESKLTKEGTKLIESLKKSIDTSNQINDTLIHAKENEQSLRNSTKTFYETFVKDLDNVREQLNEFKENHANSVNTIQENMNKSVEKQTTVMEHSSTKLHSFSEESKMKLKNAKIETKEYSAAHAISTTKCQNEIKCHSEKQQQDGAEYNKIFNSKLKEMMESLTNHKTEIVSWMKEMEEQSTTVESELAVLVGVQSQETTAFVDSQLTMLKELSKTQISEMEETLSTFSNELKKVIKNEYAFSKSMTETHENLNLELGQHIAALTEQDDLFSKTITKHEQMQESLKKLSLKIQNENLKNVEKRGAEFINTFENEMDTITKALNVHADNALPKCEILTNKTNQLSNYLNTETANQKSLLTNQLKELKNICGTNMLGSTISRADTQREQLAELNKNVCKNTDMQVKTLNKQQNELEETLTHHNANGSTLTEEKHANTISKLDKHFEQHVSQQTFNINNQMMNLKDTVDFHKESRNARQQDLNVNIQTCENDVKTHTDTHKKLIEEQQKLFQDSLMEHKAKQEVIVKNVVTEMQRLLKQEMEEMTEMFSEKVISLTAKANSMEKNAQHMSEKILEQTGNISKQTNKWVDECNETVSKLEVVIDENDKMQNHLKESTIIVTKNIDELQGETKDWGTCGRKVAENLVKVTKASEDVEQNVKDMNLNVQEQVKTLSEGTTNWEENNIQTSESICNVQDEITKTVGMIDTAKNEVHIIATSVLNETKAWGNQSNIFNDSIGNTLNQLKDIKEQYISDQSSTQDSITKGHDKFMNSFETLNGELNVNMEKQQSQLQEKKANVANVIVANEKVAFEKLKSKFEALQAHTKNVSVKTVNDMHAMNVNMENTCKNLQNQVVEFNSSNENQIVDIQHTMIDYFNNASTEFVNLNALCGNFTTMSIQHEAEMQKTMLTYENLNKEITETFVSTINEMIQEDINDTQLFCKNRETFIVNFETATENIHIDLNGHYAECKKLLEDLDSSHKDQMATMILSTATEFKNIHEQNLDEFETLTSTFCNDTVAMNAMVEKVALPAVIKYSEDLSCTLADVLILKDVPDVVIPEEIQGNNEESKSLIKDDENPPAPSIDIEPKIPPNGTPSKKLHMKTIEVLSKSEENENIIPNSGKKVKRTPGNRNIKGSIRRNKRIKKPLGNHR